MFYRPSFSVGKRGAVLFLAVLEAQFYIGFFERLEKKPDIRPLIELMRTNLRPVNHTQNRLSP
jgi:hypothetical protein